MTLPDLLAQLQLQELRLETIRAARARVDVARQRHDMARKLLELLERRRVNAQALDLARSDVRAARTELTRARRALIGAITL